MKKYFLIFIISVFIPVFIFLPKEKVFAQFPSFEVYSSTCGGAVNCHSYPEVVTPKIISKSNAIYAQAVMLDVSGVLSATATIKRTGAEDLIVAMYDDGSHNDNLANDNVFGTSDISTSTWPAGASILADITATDRLFNSNVYANVASFSLPQVGELWATVADDAWSNTGDPYNTYFRGSRAQFVVLASELSSIGMVAGDKITAIYLRGNQIPGQDLGSFKIRAKTIGIQTQSTSWEGEFATFFSADTILKTDAGFANKVWKKYEFSSEFAWTGDNIMIDISKYGIAWGSGGGGLYVRKNLGANRMLAGGCDACSPLLIDRITGSANGGAFSYCPALKIEFIRP